MKLSNDTSALEAATQRWIFQETLIELAQTNRLLRWVVRRALERAVKKHQDFRSKAGSDLNTYNPNSVLAGLSSGRF